MVMLTTFKMLARGGIMLDPTGENSYNVPMVSFVDDNTIAHTADINKTSEEMFETVTEEMVHWRNFLCITGGDLVATQHCTVTLMKWKWNQRTGFPAMMNENEAPGTVAITDDIGGKIETYWLT